jgi:hypothetical protein
MAIKTLTVAALAVTIAATLPAAAAQNTKWYDDGHWTVWQFTNNATFGTACFAALGSQTPTGYASVGFSQNDTRSISLLQYIEPSINWNLPQGTITMQIDSNAPWTVNTVRSNDGHGLLASLGASSSDSVKRFANQVQYGHVLNVTSGAGTRTFALGNARVALSGLVDCLTSIEAANGHVITVPTTRPPVAAMPARPRPVAPVTRPPAVAPGSPGAPGAPDSPA